MAVLESREQDHATFADRWRKHLETGGIIEKTFLFPRLRSHLGDLTGKVVLDAGCGGGWSTPLLRDAGAKKIVLSDFNIFLLRDAIATLGLPAVCADLRQMPFENKTFDAVLCKGVFMNQDDESVMRTLRELSRICVPNGQMVGMIVHPLWHFIVNQAENFRTMEDIEAYLKNERLSLDSIPGVSDYHRYRRPMRWYEKAFKESGWSGAFESVFIDRAFEGMPDRYQNRVGGPPIFSIFNASKIA